MPDVATSESQDPSATEVATEESRPEESRPEGERRQRRGVLLGVTSRRLLAPVVLTVILLVGLVVRLVGSRFGDPLMLHPDEPWIVNGVIDMARRHSFEPPWALHPDHVEMKVDYLLFTGYAGIVKHTSVTAAFASHPFTFYWIARLFTVATGVLTIWFAYLIGRRWSRPVGLVAAALFALFPAYVRNSHFATPDMPLACAVMALIYVLMRYVERPRWRAVVWASVCLAISIAIKYPGFVGLAMIGLVILLCAIRDRAWLRMVAHGALALVATVVALFVISPSLFTDIHGVWNQLSDQAGSAVGYSDLGLSGNVRFYWDTYVQFSGYVLALFGLVGLVVVARRRRLDTVPWAVGVVFLLSLSAIGLHWERWGTPMWVTPLLLGAVGIVEAWAWCRARWQQAIVAVAALVVAVQLVAFDGYVDALLHVSDTRAASIDFAQSHHITRKNSIYDGYSTLMPGSPKTFFLTDSAFAEQVRPAADGYALYSETGRRATYAVISSTMYGRVKSAPEYAKYRPVYRWVFQHGTLLEKYDSIPVPRLSPFEAKGLGPLFGQIDDAMHGEHTGPVIWIYRLPTVPAPAKAAVAKKAATPGSAAAKKG